MYSHRLRQPAALWQKRCRSLTGALFLAVLLNLVCLWTASAEDNSASAAVPFTGEVRYHFREKLSGVAAGDKSMSAPATETEKLPTFRLETIDGKPVYRVAGQVKHLPLDFDIQLVHVANPDSDTLKVNVTDPASQKPLVGFPQTIPNATAKLKEGIDLKIALSPEQKAKIEQSALSSCFSIACLSAGSSIRRRINRDFVIYPKALSA